MQGFTKLTFLLLSSEAPLLAAVTARTADDPLADLLEDEETSNELGKISVETSKYLGGDEKYTHLVRGLDKTLLEKVRADLKTQEATEAELAEAEEYVRRIEGDTVPEFNGPMGKAIYDLIVNGASQKLPETNPLFAPGRMAFVFDLGFDSGVYTGSDDLPTTLMRSRMEIKSDEASRKESDMVVLKVAEAFEALRTKGASGFDNEDYIIGEDGKRRIRRKDKEQRAKKADEAKGVAAAPKPKAPPKEIVVGIDDDEDIFGDAGRDYTLEVDDRRRREAETKLAVAEGKESEPLETEEDTFGPQIPAEFRRARSEESAEGEEDVFGPQIPAEFRGSRNEGDEGDEEMEEAGDEGEDTFGPQMPAEFQREESPSDDGVDEEEEYRRRTAAAFVAPATEEPRQVRTDYFGKVIVDGREVSEEDRKDKGPAIADLVRSAAGETAAAELGPNDGFAGLAAAGTKKARKRVHMDDEGDYYTGLGGSYGYDSDDGEAFGKSAEAKRSSEGRKGKGGPKGEDGKKKQKLNQELQQVDKKMKEKFGRSLQHGKGKQ